jgi:hypothetical protein
MGFFLDDGPYGEKITETITCCHCQKIEVKDLKSQAMCHHCWKPVCAGCHAHGRCTPFEKRLDRFEKRVREQEARGVFRRSMGL